MGAHTHKKRRKLIIEIFLVAFAGFAMIGLFCWECMFDPILFLKSGTFSSTIWIAMWFGNGLINDWINSYVSWLENPIKRLILAIVGYTIYPIVGMYLIVLFFNWLWGFNQESTSYLISAVVITFIIASFMSARQFFIAWRQLAVNQEKMKKEAVTSRYESLKNQVNPHFLFNSLNALTTLIYQNQDEAAKFVKQLSKVYRYVLDIKDHEVVSVSKEVEFLSSYTFMQKTRHTNGLFIHVDVDVDTNVKIVPLSLQMLVENAIKHNEISIENPLTVSIFIENDYLVVSNNLQKRTPKETSTSSIGLDNIKKRYQFLTNKDVSVEEGPDNFVVRIPLLHISDLNEK